MLILGYNYLDNFRIYTSDGLVVVAVLDEHRIGFDAPRSVKILRPNVEIDYQHSRRVVPEAETLLRECRFLLSGFTGNHVGELLNKIDHYLSTNSSTSHVAPTPPTISTPKPYSSTESIPCPNVRSTSGPSPSATQLVSSKPAPLAQFFAKQSVASSEPAS